MRIATITAPAEEPLTLAGLRLFLKVDDDNAADDTLITALIAGARSWCETFTRRALVTQTLELVLDGFPPCAIANPRRQIVLPRGRATAVDWISYVDADGVTQTLTGPTSSPAGTGYQEDLTDDYGGILVPAYGTDWPATRDVVGAVRVRFRAGYGAASAIPAQLLDAMRYHAATMYEARGEQDTKAWTGVAEALARPYQIGWFGS